MAMLNNQMVLVENMLTTVYMSMRVVNEVVRLWRSQTVSMGKSRTPTTRCYPLGKLTV